MRNRFFGETARSGMRRSRLVAALAAAALLSGVAFTQPVAPAFAKEWPTWDEVREARADERAAKAERARIEGLLVGLRAGAEAAVRAAEETNAVYMAADEAFQEAHRDAERLQQLADDAQASAEAARIQAGRLIAHASRFGGGDVLATLVAEAGDATELLQMLGRAGQLTVQTDAIHAVAIQRRNTAQALTDEAEAARAVREDAKDQAEAAYREAQRASQAAQAALDEEQRRAAELEAQLAVLTDARKDLDAAYREYQDELANQPGAGEDTTPGVIANGWTWPTSGRITSPFGNRVHPVSGDWSFHYGTDIAGGCGVPIYAAAGGTVDFLGYSPTGFGNYIRVDHGGGVTTQYAHIMPGGARVGSGERVAPGQLIAYTGTTGNSTGCHLHFEVRLDGIATDPVPYIRNKGVPVG